MNLSWNTLVLIIAAYLSDSVLSDENELHRSKDQVAHVPAPSNVLVRPYQSTLVVSWTPSGTNWGIVWYLVEYRAMNSNATYLSCEVPGNQENSTLPDQTLQLGTRYSVRVAAVTQLGTGEYSESVTGTTYNVPRKVSSVTVTRVHRSSIPGLSVQWTKPESDLRITSYILEYSTTGGEVVYHKNLGAGFNKVKNKAIYWLLAGTTYRVRVKAVSSLGEGEFSDDIIQTTFKVPDQVTGVDYSASSNNNPPSLVVSWDPVQDNETHVTHYEVQYWEDRELQPLLMTYSENATINTSADSTYHITVSAVSVIGRGAWSNIVTVTVDAYTETLLPYALMVGFISGITSVLLFFAVTWGACKLFTSRKKLTTAEQRSTDSEPEEANGMKIYECPAYVSVDDNLYDIINNEPNAVECLYANINEN